MNGTFITRKNSALTATAFMAAALWMGCKRMNHQQPETKTPTPGHQNVSAQHDEANPPEGGHGHHVQHSPEEWAQRLDDPMRDAWQKPKEVIAALHIAPGQTVVEIGAGTGYFLKYLSEAVGDQGHVAAHDVDADLVVHMEKRAEKEHLKNVSAVLCPFDDPALKPSSVDRIVLVNTWHHISNRVPYGKKLFAALKPGGTVYIVDFEKHSSVGPPPEAKLTPDQVIQELTDAGFKTVLQAENLPEQYIIQATLP